MKRTVIALAALAAVSLAFTACQKEENHQVAFTATTETYAPKGAKTAIATDGHTINWVQGDVVAWSKYVTGQPIITGYYSATPSSANPTMADFSFNGTGTDVSAIEGESTLLYPTTLVDESYQMTLPTVETSVNGELTGFPMIGEMADGNHAIFKNVCGVVKFNLTKADITVSSISISTNRSINGVATSEGPLYPVELTGLTSNMTYLQAGDSQTEPDATCTTTLQLTNPQDITSGKSFYMYLPEGEFEQFVVKIYTDDNRVATLTARNTISVERSKITSITVGNSLDFSDVNAGTETDNTTHHLFSVSASQQVYFSRGNLVWESNDGTERWYFAENQLDYLGSNNSLTHMDVFTWPEAHSHYGTLASTQHNCNHAFMDWGQLVIDGCPANTWRTLSYDEWTYLVNTRTMQNGTARTWKGTFSIGGNNVYALVIYPDDMPANGVLSASSTSASEETYEGLCELGCAILPFAGYFQSRTNSSMPSITSVNSEGNYATSTMVSNNQYWSTKKLFRIPSNWNAGADYCTVSIEFGCSVRLVQDALQPSK